MRLRSMIATGCLTLFVGGAGACAEGDETNVTGGPSGTGGESSSSTSGSSSSSGGGGAGGKAGAGGVGGGMGGEGGMGGGAGGAGGVGGGAGGAGGVPMPVEDCDNTADDDADGQIDCADSDCTAAAVCGTLVINEVNYDQVDADTEEYIEILNTGAGPVDLTGVYLIRVNGSNSMTYPVGGDIALQGTLAAGQYLVIASSTVVGIDPGAMVVTFANPQDNVQNGGSPAAPAADAVVLFDSPNQKVLDSISYEGPINAAVIFGGTYDLVSGTPTLAQDSGLMTAPPHSMIRLPNGQDTGDDAADWSVTTILTPGAPNQQSTEACANTFDDDFDMLVDCADPDCVAEPACQPVEICDNGLDDENDMLVDCADTVDCDGQTCGAFGSICMGGMCACPGGLMESVCGDLMDNDCDGDIDCADADCFMDLICTTSNVSGVSYQVITHGGKLVITGANLLGSTEVTIGGVPQTFVVDSNTQITIDLVGDATPLGAQDLVVTTPGGPTAPFGLTVIHLLINEVDADQEQTDTAEFVEISTGFPGSPGVPNVNLTGYTLVLWQGSAAGNNVAVRKVELNGVTDANGLLVIGPVAVPGATIPFINKDTDAIENGPDGMGVYQAPETDFTAGVTTVMSANLIDAVVHETSDAGEATTLLDVLLGPVGAPERVQIDEGSTGTTSIQRCGDGRKNGSRFAIGMPPTPGAANNVPPCP